MPTEITIEVDKNLISVKFIDYITFNEFRNEGIKLRDYAFEHGKMNYLLDFRLAKGLSRTWPIALFSPTYWETVAQMSERIAIILKKGDIHNLGSMGALARNAGIDFNVFTKIDGAYQWLGMNTE